MQLNLQKQTFTPNSRRMPYGSAAHMRALRRHTHVDRLVCALCNGDQALLAHSTYTAQTCRLQSVLMCFRQGQEAQNAQPGGNSTAAMSAVMVPNPAESKGLNSLPTGNAASIAAASPAHSEPSGQAGQPQQPKSLSTLPNSNQAGSSTGQIGQAQQPKTLPATTYAAQAGTAGSPAGALGAQLGNSASSVAASPAQARSSMQLGQPQQPKALPSVTTAVLPGSAGSPAGILGARPGNAQAPATVSQQSIAISSGASGGASGRGPTFDVRLPPGLTVENTFKPLCKHAMM